MSSDLTSTNIYHSSYYKDDFLSLVFLSHSTINATVFFMKEKIVDYLNLLMSNKSIQIDFLTLKTKIDEFTFEFKEISERLEAHFREVSEIEKKYPATKPIHPVKSKRYWELVKMPMDDLQKARIALINLTDLLITLKN